MMENSGVSEPQVPTLDLGCLSKEELMFLAIFRMVCSTRHADVLRILEVFALTTEQ